MSGCALNKRFSFRDFFLLSISLAVTCSRTDVGCVAVSLIAISYLGISHCSG